MVINYNFGKTLEHCKKPPNQTKGPARLSSPMSVGSLRRMLLKEKVRKYTYNLLISWFLWYISLFGISGCLLKQMVHLFIYKFFYRTASSDLLADRISENLQKRNAHLQGWRNNVCVISTIPLQILSV